MKTLDEITREPISDPDLSAGFLHLHLDVTKQDDGSYTSETVQLYHEYTDEELAAKNKTPVTWAELAAAYNEGVLSVGQ